jgi:hypothetical protein
MTTIERTTTERPLCPPLAWYARFHAGLTADDLIVVLLSLLADYIVEPERLEMAIATRAAQLRGGR